MYLLIFVKIIIVTVFIVLLSWYCHCVSSSSQSDECSRMAPSSCQSVANLGCESAPRLHDIYHQPASWYLLAPRLLSSTLTIYYYSSCQLIHVSVLCAVYQSIIRTCCHEMMLDPVSDTGSDRGELDFTRQKITYRAYIGLWTTLLHLTTVKACCSICLLYTSPSPRD